MGTFPSKRVPMGDPNKAYDLYVNQGFSMAEIGKRWGMNRVTIWRYLMRVGGVGVESKIKHLRSRQNLMKERKIMLEGKPLE